MEGGSSSAEEQHGVEVPDASLQSTRISPPSHLSLPPMRTHAPAARAIASEQGHTGALLPTHVRQAYQQLDWEGKVPHRAPPKRLMR